ncbi:MAG: Gfo/Idh/MocA family oxidoreductase, partial [Planctomycetia bacterium]|nr:Gfo/Idh/MocA family oxidoreductase [Planctomycetia bacterium]
KTSTVSVVLPVSAAVPRVIAGSVLGMDGTLPPSDRITIGIFGVGNRGSDSIRAMRPLPDHQIVAIADCRRERAERARDVVNAMYAERAGSEDYKGCDITWDFEEVIDRPDIDVLWGTVPDHWHGPIYSRMIRSGKDIYGEKPLTRYVHQGVKVVRMARQYGTIFQVGTQQRSSSHFRHACELARNGYLGRVHTIEVAAPRGEAYPTVKPCPVPEGFHYDRWSGPAPLFPFDERRCEWLAMYMISHYCAGFITNWGVHHLDIAGWGVPEVFEKPFSLEGTGEMPRSGMTDTWVKWRVKMTWESGLVLDYCSTGDPHPQGCRFVGDEGWVHVNRGQIRAEPASLVDVRMKDTDIHLHVSPGSDRETLNPGYAYTPHTADFFRSVRTRQDPVSPIEQGHGASTLGNLSDIALRVKRRLNWDWERSDFLNDPDASGMLSRAERAPWTV